MIDEEIAIKQQAEEFSRLNKKRIAVELTDISKYEKGGQVPFTILKILMRLGL